MNGIYFPGFGIGFGNIPENLNIFGLKIPLYAVVITAGFLLALKIASVEAKKTGQNPEDYLDFFLVLVIPAILGARIYYIIFNLDRFVGKGRGFWGTLWDMINIRNGGLAVYGGLIAGVTAGVIFTRVKKIYLPIFGDNIAMGVLVGQILGRWGNFFNREAFGGFTKSIFRMAIPYDYYSESFKEYMFVNGITNDQMLKNTELVNNVQCITVHPTFLYEALWNVALLLFIFFYRKRKRFDGELAMIYIFGYGVGRVIVEAARTDSLMIGPLKVSQLVGIVTAAVALAVMIKNYSSIKKGKEPVCHRVGECGEKTENTDKKEKASDKEVEEKK